MSDTIQSIIHSYRVHEATWKDTVEKLVHFDYTSPETEKKMDVENVSAVALLGGILAHKQEQPQEEMEQHEGNLQDFVPPATGVDGDPSEPVVEPGVVADFVPGSFDEVRKAVNDGLLDLDTYEIVLQGVLIRQAGGTPELIEG